MSLNLKKAQDEASAQIEPEQVDTGLEQLDHFAKSILGGTTSQIGPRVDLAAAYLRAEATDKSHQRDPNVKIYRVGALGGEITLYPHQLTGVAWMQAHQASGMTLAPDATKEQREAAMAIEEVCGLMTNGGIVRDITGFGKTRLIAADAALDATGAVDRLFGERVYRPRLVLSLSEELVLQTAADMVGAGFHDHLNIIISVGDAAPSGPYAHLAEYWVSRDQYIGNEECESIEVAFDQTNPAAQATVILSTYMTSLYRDLVWEVEYVPGASKDPPSTELPEFDKDENRAVVHTGLNTDWRPVDKNKEFEVPVKERKTKSTGKKTNAKKTRTVKGGWQRRMAFVRRSDAFGKFYLDEGHKVKDGTSQTALALKELGTASKFVFTASHTVNKLSVSISGVAALLHLTDRFGRKS